MSIVNFQSTNKSSQTGFTLLEVLVSVIVLAIGLLGLAGLQASSMRFNQSAYLRSQATVMAYDIIDRMRANIVSARNGDYNFTVSDVTPTGTTQLADIDRQQWRTTLSHLPSGTGGINIVYDSTKNQYNATVNVQWGDVEWDSTNPKRNVTQQFVVMTKI